MHRCNTLVDKNEVVKFIYSEKATKFCEIFTLLLSYVVPVKSKVKISQNFVAFSEYMNFNGVANRLVLYFSGFFKSPFSYLFWSMSFGLL